MAVTTTASLHSAHLGVEGEDGGNCEWALEATLAGALGGQVLRHGGHAAELAAARAARTDKHFN